MTRPESRRLVLASASPRRKSILAEHGFSFDVVPARICEDVLEGETPSDHVLRIAREKARAVACHFPDSVVLGADTVIAFQGRVIGKPIDHDDAVRILTELSGRHHEVLTGYCILIERDGRECSDFVSTDVLFRALSDEEIEEYVRTGEPLDKAGAYAVQGGAERFVQSLNGSIANVVGLPIESLVPILLDFGLINK